MKLGRFVSLAAAAVLLTAQAPVPAPVPVVVELFTSEGCSSCPPADQVLSKLLKDQPVAGVQVIALGMHVTYWDQLGWKDPASLPVATERQQTYGTVWGGDSVYTPQAVVDGREEMVGSDEAGLKRAIAKAAHQPHARVGLHASVDGSSLKVDATIADVPADAKEPIESWMAVTEDDISTVVKRGENGGRTLHHDAVVHVVFGGELAAARVLGFHATLRPEWRRDHLKAVVVLQGKKTHRIYGAAATPLK